MNRKNRLIIIFLYFYLGIKYPLGNTLIINVLFLSDRTVFCIFLEKY